MILPDASLVALRHGRIGGYIRKYPAE